MGQEQAEKTSQKALSLYIQPLGGNNTDRIGSNCNLVVAGELTGSGLVGDGVLMDFGVHPARKTPDGWTQRFPDIRYLLKPESPVKLRAIFLSHGHDDHDGAIMRYLEAGYSLPPVYADPLALNFLREKLRSARIPKTLWPEMKEYTGSTPLHEIPGFEEFVPVRMGHSLAGQGYLVRAAGRGVFFSSDFKLDQTTLTPPTDLQQLDRLGQSGKVDLLLVDSTRAAQDGMTPPEAEVRENLRELAERHPHHRINLAILGTNAEGLARAGWLAAQTGRILVHHGASIERTLRAMNNCAMDLPTLAGSEDLQIFSGRSQIAQSLSPSHALNVMAGANGERGSVIARASRDEDHHLQFGAEDIVILSASTLPWNRKKIEGIFAGLRAQGVEHIYLDQGEGKYLHASGHEHGDGILRLAELLKPRAVTPMHGSSAQRQACAARFNRMAGAPEVLTAENGDILEVSSVGPVLVGHEHRPLTEAPARPVWLRPHPQDLKAA
jgi:ribonuclease J